MEEKVSTCHHLLHNKPSTSQIRTPTTHCTAQKKGYASCYKLRAQFSLKTCLKRPSENMQLVNWVEIQKHWNLRGKRALCRRLTSPKIPFSLWRWTVISGFIKLLASMGIPIPRLADWLFVKDGNHYRLVIMQWKSGVKMKRNTQYYVERCFNRHCHTMHSLLFNHFGHVGGLIIIVMGE